MHKRHFSNAANRARQAAKRNDRSRSPIQPASPMHQSLTSRGGSSPSGPSRDGSPSAASSNELKKDVWKQHFPDDRPSKGIKLFDQPEILMDTPSFVAKVVKSPVRTAKYFKFHSTLFTLKTEKKMENSVMPLLSDSFQVFRTLIEKVLNSIRMHFTKINDQYHHQVYLSINLSKPYIGSLNTRNFSIWESPNIISDR